MEKISVIVPIYNSEKFLDKCINSIVNQTYKNIEVILIDDGSKDESKKICKKYVKKDARVRLIECSNSGVSHARNIGLENSSGDYLFFVDSDDWINLDTLERMILVAKKSNVDVVKCNYYNNYIDNKEQVNELNITNCEENLSILDSKKIKELFANTYILNVVWGELISRKTLKNCRFEDRLIYGEDLLFNFQVLKNTDRVLLMKDSYYHYLINQAGTNQNYDYNVLIKKIENLNYVYNKIIDFYDEKEKISYKYLKEVIDNLRKISFTQNKMKLINEIVFKEINCENFKEACQNVNLKKVNTKYKLSIILLKKNKYKIFVILSNILYKNIWYIKEFFKSEKRRIKRKSKKL